MKSNFWINCRSKFFKYFLIFSKICINTNTIAYSISLTSSTIQQNSVFVCKTINCKLLTRKIFHDKHIFFAFKICINLLLSMEFFSTFCTISNNGFCKDRKIFCRNIIRPTIDFRNIHYLLQIFIREFLREAYFCGLRWRCYNLTPKFFFM